VYAHSAAMKFDRKIEREGNNKKNTACKYQIMSYTANSLVNKIKYYARQEYSIEMILYLGTSAKLINNSIKDPRPFNV